jgi:cobalt-zinc-cadmium resistance protein CzcA
MQRQVEKNVSSLPEVEMMFSKTGTAEVATDPMPPNASDGFIILKPQKEWPKEVANKAKVVERIEAKVAPLLGNSFEVTQPIQMRFNELIAGVRGDVAIKLYGDDLEKMSATAAKIGSVLESIPGAEGVRVEQVGGAPTLDVKFDRAAIARFGLSIDQVADTVATAMGGRQAGDVFEGDRRFDITVRVPMAQRDDLDALGALPVMLPAGEGGVQRSVPLRELVQFRFADGLNQISREDGKRRVVIQVNVRGRDIGSFVNEARSKVEAVELPTGYWLTWGGQFENLKAATQRLSIVVPLCFVLIFLVLYMALGGFGPAASVFAAIPLGLSGGVFALALTGITFSISAAVGFIVLAGVAVLNGLVVMTSVRERLEAGVPVVQAIYEGSVERFRPVLMTGLVPAIGFIPMALASGTGAEVQKPLAMVVIGGLVTATAVTLLVLPAIAKLILQLGSGRKAPDEGPAASPLSTTH